MFVLDICVFCCYGEDPFPQVAYKRKRLNSVQSLFHAKIRQIFFLDRPFQFPRNSSYSRNQVLLCFTLIFCKYHCYQLLQHLMHKKLRNNSPIYVSAKKQMKVEDSYFYPSLNQSIQSQNRAQGETPTYKGHRIERPCILVFLSDTFYLLLSKFPVTFIDL